MRSRSVLALTWVVSLGFAGAAAAQPCAREWRDFDSPEPGIVQSVRALATFNDGAGTALFAGGIFTQAGGIAANRIVRWDGQNWSALDSGLNNEVGAMAVYDDGGGADLYVAGAFTSAGGVPVRRVARWDGTTWSVLGSNSFGPNVGSVRALAVYNDGAGDALYVGGQFTTVGSGISGSGRIAKWDGVAWSAVGGGMSGGNVYALTVHNDGSGDALYAAGSFTTAGGAPANRIAKWDGVAWSPLGNGIGDNEVFALASFNDGSGPALYAAGWFTMASGQPTSLIAKWDGESWSPLADGHNSDIRSLAVFDDGSGPALYAGGFFNTLGAYRIARWDGQTWSPLGMGIDWDLGTVQDGSVVLAMCGFDDGSGLGPALIAGGEFHLAGEEGAQNIASWQCAGPPACAADFNGDGDANSQDFFDFLTAFFAQLPSADFNQDTVVNSQDFFDFLTAFFAGC